MIHKPGPFATKCEVALAKALPETQKLEEMLEALKEVTQAVGGSGHIDMRKMMAGHEFDNLAEKIANILRTPIGADFLFVILPTLIDVSFRGRAEAGRRHGPPEDPRKSY